MKKPAATTTPRDLVDNCSLNGTTTAESKPMLKRQAAALLTADTDEESEMLLSTYLIIKPEGRPNLEDGQNISLAAGFPSSESTSGQATGPGLLSSLTCSSGRRDDYQVFCIKLAFYPPRVIQL